MRQIKRIFVHCTAGPQNQSVEAIKQYWKNHNKWINPGYHYIIKANGEIVKLQPEDKPSNGVAGYNSTSINVCYIGGVDKCGKPIDNRTEYQKESLIYILKELKTRYPDAEILGHRDIWGSNPKNWKKMCPCFDAKTEYARLMDPEPLEEPIQEPEQPVETPTEQPVEQENTEEQQEQPEESKKKKSFISILIKIVSELFKNKSKNEANLQ